MRERTSGDKERLDLSVLPVQRHNGRWYNRIGQFLVDEDVDEQTDITLVRFGSEAYFQLVQGRPELRPVLAANRNVVVIVAPDRALLVADGAGIERFSDNQMEHFGLIKR